MNAPHIAYTLRRMARLAETGEIALRTRGSETTAWIRNDGVLRKLFSFPTALRSAVLLRIEHGAGPGESWARTDDYAVGGFASVSLRRSASDPEYADIRGLSDIPFAAGSMTVIAVASHCAAPSVLEALRVTVPSVRAFSLEQPGMPTDAIQSAVYEALAGGAACLVGVMRASDIPRLLDALPAAVTRSVYAGAATHRLERQSCASCVPPGSGCARCEGTGITGHRHAIAPVGKHHL